MGPKPRRNRGGSKKKNGGSPAAMQLQEAPTSKKVETKSGSEESKVSEPSCSSGPSSGKAASYPEQRTKVEEAELPYEGGEVGAAALKLKPGMPSVETNVGDLVEESASASNPTPEHMVKNSDPAPDSVDLIVTDESAARKAADEPIERDPVKVTTASDKEEAIPDLAAEEIAESSGPTAESADSTVQEDSAARKVAGLTLVNRRPVKSISANDDEHEEVTNSTQEDPTVSKLPVLTLRRRPVAAAAPSDSQREVMTALAAEEVTEFSDGMAGRNDSVVQIDSATRNATDLPFERRCPMKAVTPSDNQEKTVPISAVEDIADVSATTEGADSMVEDFAARKIADLHFVTQRADKAASGASEDQEDTKSILAEKEDVGVPDSVASTNDSIVQENLAPRKVAILPFSRRRPVKAAASASEDQKGEAKKEDAEVSDSTASTNDSIVQETSAARKSTGLPFARWRPVKAAASEDQEEAKKEDAEVSDSTASTNDSIVQETSAARKSAGLPFARRRPVKAAASASEDQKEEAKKEDAEVSDSVSTNDSIVQEKFSARKFADLPFMMRRRPVKAAASTSEDQKEEAKNEDADVSDSIASTNDSIVQEKFAARKFADWFVVMRRRPVKAAASASEDQKEEAKKEDAEVSNSMAGTNYSIVQETSAASKFADLPVVRRSPVKAAACASGDRKEEAKKEDADVSDSIASTNDSIVQEKFAVRMFADWPVVMRRRPVKAAASASGEQKEEAKKEDAEVSNSMADTNDLIVQETSAARKFADLPVVRRSPVKAVASASHDQKEAVSISAEKEESQVSDPVIRTDESIAQKDSAVRKVTDLSSEGRRPMESETASDEHDVVFQGASDEVVQGSDSIRTCGCRDSAIKKLMDPTFWAPYKTYTPYTMPHVTRRPVKAAAVSVQPTPCANNVELGAEVRDVDQRFAELQDNVERHSEPSDEVNVGQFDRPTSLLKSPQIEKSRLTNLKPTEFAATDCEDRSTTSANTGMVARVDDERFATPVNVELVVSISVLEEPSTTPSDVEIVVTDAEMSATPVGIDIDATNAEEQSAASANIDIVGKKVEERPTTLVDVDIDATVADIVGRYAEERSTTPSDFGSAETDTETRSTTPYEIDTAEIGDNQQLTTGAADVYVHERCRLPKATDVTAVIVEQRSSSPEDEGIEVDSEPSVSPTFKDSPVEQNADPSVSPTSKDSPVEQNADQESPKPAEAYHPRLDSEHQSYMSENIKLLEDPNEKSALLADITALAEGSRAPNKFENVRISTGYSPTSTELRTGDAAEFHSSNTPVKDQGTNTNSEHFPTDTEVGATDAKKQPSWPKEVTMTAQDCKMQLSLNATLKKIQAAIIDLEKNLETRHPEIVSIVDSKNFGSLQEIKVPLLSEKPLEMLQKLKPTEVDFEKHPKTPPKVQVTVEASGKRSVTFEKCVTLEDIENQLRTPEESEEFHSSNTSVKDQDTNTNSEHFPTVTEVGATNAKKQPSWPKEVTMTAQDCKMQLSLNATLKKIKAAIKDLEKNLETRHPEIVSIVDSKNFGSLQKIKVPLLSEKPLEMLQKLKPTEVDFEKHPKTPPKVQVTVEASGKRSVTFVKCVTLEDIENQLRTPEKLEVTDDSKPPVTIMKCDLNVENAEMPVKYDAAVLDTEHQSEMPEKCEVAEISSEKQSVTDTDDEKKILHMSSTSESKMDKTFVVTPIVTMDASAEHSSQTADLSETVVVDPNQIGDEQVRVQAAGQHSFSSSGSIHSVETFSDAFDDFFVNLADGEFEPAVAKFKEINAELEAFLRKFGLLGVTPADKCRAPGGRKTNSSTFNTLTGGSGVGPVSVPAIQNIYSAPNSGYATIIHPTEGLETTKDSLPSADRPGVEENSPQPAQTLDSTSVIPCSSYLPKVGGNAHKPADALDPTETSIRSECFLKVEAVCPQTEAALALLATTALFRSTALTPIEERHSHPAEKLDPTESSLQSTDFPPVEETSPRTAEVEDPTKSSLHSTDLAPVEETSPRTTEKLHPAKTAPQIRNVSPVEDNSPQTAEERTDLLPVEKPRSRAAEELDSTKLSLQSTDLPPVEETSPRTAKEHDPMKPSLHRTDTSPREETIPRMADDIVPTKPSLHSTDLSGVEQTSPRTAQELDTAKSSLHSMGLCLVEEISPRTTEKLDPAKPSLQSTVLSSIEKSRLQTAEELDHTNASLQSTDLPGIEGTSPRTADEPDPAKSSLHSTDLPPVEESSPRTLEEVAPTKSSLHNMDIPEIKKNCLQAAETIYSSEASKRGADLVEGCAQLADALDLTRGSLHSVDITKSEENCPDPAATLELTGTPLHTVDLSAMDSNLWKYRDWDLRRREQIFDSEECTPTNLSPTMSEGLLYGMKMDREDIFFSCLKMGRDSLGAVSSTRDLSTSMCEKMFALNNKAGTLTQNEDKAPTESEVICDERNSADTSAVSTMCGGESATDSVPDGNYCSNFRHNRTPRDSFDSDTTDYAVPIATEALLQLSRLPHLKSMCGVSSPSSKDANIAGQCCQPTTKPRKDLGDEHSPLNSSSSNVKSQPIPFCGDNMSTESSSLCSSPLQERDNKFESPDLDSKSPVSNPFLVEKVGIDKTLPAKRSVHADDSLRGPPSTEDAMNLTSRNSDLCSLEVSPTVNIVDTGNSTPTTEDDSMESIPSSMPSLEAVTPPEISDHVSLPSASLPSQELDIDETARIVAKMLTVADVEYALMALAKEAVSGRRLSASSDDVLYDTSSGNNSSDTLDVCLKSDPHAVDRSEENVGESNSEENAADKDSSEVATSDTSKEQDSESAYPSSVSSRGSYLDPIKRTLMRLSASFENLVIGSRCPKTGPEMECTKKSAETEDSDNDLFSGECEGSSSHSSFSDAHDENEEIAHGPNSSLLVLEAAKSKENDLISGEPSTLTKLLVQAAKNEEFFENYDPETTIPGTAQLLETQSPKSTTPLPKNLCQRKREGSISMTKWVTSSDKSTEVVDLVSPENSDSKL